MDTSAVSQSIEQPAESLLQTITGFVGDQTFAAILTAVLVLIATSIIAHLVTRFLRHLLSHDNSPLPSSTIFINIARVVMWGIGFSIILSTCFGVDVTAIVAALGVGGIALSLGLQDTISNLVGGLQVSILGVIEPGDRIEVGGVHGYVRDVTWRQTTIETALGDIVVIPNADINKKTFTKLCHAEKVVIPFYLDKATADLDGVAKRIEEASRTALQDQVELEKGPAVLYAGTSEYGHSGSVVIWLVNHTDMLRAKDLVTRAIAPFIAECER